MELKRLTAMVAAVAIGASASALAGFTQPAPVDVDLANGFAGGDQVSARGDKDKDVFIGCGSRTFSSGGSTFRTGFCQAEDADGDRVLCFTQDPDLLDEMRATSAYSFITFSFVDDGAGGFTCTRVGFSTQSFYLEKVKPN